MFCESPSALSTGRLDAQDRDRGLRQIEKDGLGSLRHANVAGKVGGLDAHEEPM